MAVIIPFIAATRAARRMRSPAPGPPSHWRSLIFCRIAVGQTKRCLNPELSVCFRPIETTHPVWAERRRRWERMKARAEALKHSADNPRGRFGEGENF